MIEKKVAKQWIEEDASQSGTENPQRDVEKNTSTNDTSVEPLRNSIDMPSTQATAMDDHSETIRNLDSTSTSEQKKQWGRPIIALLKSSRLLAALYGIVVESGIL
jgi:hypothetical protein